jgi:transposase
MARDFRCPERRQNFLLPPDMGDWLPEDNIVHLILDAVALIDLSAFEAAHKLGGAGQAPFAPSLLLSVLIYAYSHGVRSSRAIESPRRAARSIRLTSRAAICRPTRRTSTRSSRPGRR